MAVVKNLPLLQYTFEDNLFSRRTAVKKPEPIYVDESGKKRYFTDAISGSNNGGVHRSKTFDSIANSMAKQWGNLL